MSRTKIQTKDLAPIPDDIEPIEAPREGVEMMSEEKEEPLEAEVPRARVTHAVHNS